MASPNGGSFRVDAPAKVIRALKELGQRSLQVGLGNQMLAAVKIMYHRLMTDPMHFGDPLYHLPALNLQVRTAIVGPLIVEFAVHEQKPIVFIKGVRPMSGYGLE